MHAIVSSFFGLALVAVVLYVMFQRRRANRPPCNVVNFGSLDESRRPAPPPSGLRVLEGAPFGYPPRSRRPPSMVRGADPDDGTGDICGAPRRDPDDTHA
jgi:hypothetical protein